MKASILWSLSVFACTGLAHFRATPSTAINGVPFPSLLDVTTEELITGLEAGLFTSVQLTQVCQEARQSGFIDPPRRISIVFMKSTRRFEQSHNSILMP